MQTLLPLPLLLSLPLVSSGAGDPPALGSFAPELALERWLEPERPNEARSTGDDGTTPADLRRMMEQRGPRDLAQLGQQHGSVVVIHALDLERATRDSELLTLLRDLREANEDRSLTVLGIAAEREEADARERLADLAVDWPVALAPAESESPYVTSSATAFVVGPNRDLLFAGDAVADEKGFLAALQDAFLRPVAPPVEHALAPELDAAWTLYVTGELAKAEKAAEKVEKQARKGGTSTAGDDAAELIQLVRKAQTEWIADLRTALSSRDARTFVQRTRELERAFPRGEAQKELDELEQEARRGTGFMTSLRDNELWFDAAPDRPPLFPVRRSKAGDRYAKELEKLLQATNNSLDVTRTAERMLQRYRG